MCRKSTISQLCFIFHFSFKKIKNSKYIYIYMFMQWDHGGFSNFPCVDPGAYNIFCVLVQEKYGLMFII